MRHPKAFCARPGCRIAFAVHRRMGCGDYVDPGSKEGRAMLGLAKAVPPPLLAIVETPPPSVDVPPYVEIDFEDLTVVEAQPYGAAP